MNKVLFCIVGRTASGKDTLTNQLCKNMNMKQLISYTTRLPRYSGENTHIFVTLDDYTKDVVENNIIAQTVINDCVYWATEQQVYDSDFYIIDPKGLEELKNRNLNLHIVTIYITAEEEVRRRRFLMRQPGHQELFTQRNNSENEQFEHFEQNKMFDYIIYNDRFENALKQLSDIVYTERKNKNEI